MSKITTGINDRPRDSTTAQSGPGLPDDSGEPIEVTAYAEGKIRRKPKELAREKVKAEIDG